MWVIEISTRCVGATINLLNPVGKQLYRFYNHVVVADWIRH